MWAWKRAGAETGEEDAGMTLTWLHFAEISSFPQAPIVPQPLPPSEAGTSISFPTRQGSSGHAGQTTPHSVLSGWLPPGIQPAVHPVFVPD